MIVTEGLNSMNYTNRLNMSPNAVRMLSQDTYTRSKPSTIGVTELIKPYRISLMMSLYKKHVQEDISSRFFSWLGTIIHEHYEKFYANDPNVITEARMYKRIGNEILSGQFDLYYRDTGTLADVKTTSMYSMNKKDWEKQLNIYAYLMRSYDYLDDGIEELRHLPVNLLQVEGVARDWSESKSEAKNGFVVPPLPVIPIKLWTYEEQERFVMERIQTVSALKNRIMSEIMSNAQAQQYLPLCSDEDRWLSSSAISPKGYSRRISGLEEFNSRYGGKDGWKFSQTYIRCEKYCAVKNWCSQYNGGS